MTVLVGILCQDGVVIGADSSATSASGGIPTIEQKTHKLHLIDSKVIVAGTGAMGLGQRFQHIVETQWNSGLFKNKTSDAVTILCRETLLNFGNTGIQQPKIQYGALCAFPSNGALHLCEFEANTFQPELKTDKFWYVSMGSGQLIADPFLGFIRRVFWQDTLPTLNEGILAATWALTHTIDLNTGGIKDPINVAVLTKKKTDIEARELDEDELLEYKEQIRSLEKYIGNYKKTSVVEEKIPDPT